MGNECQSSKVSGVGVGCRTEGGKSCNAGTGEGKELSLVHVNRDEDKREGERVLAVIDFPGNYVAAREGTRRPTSVKDLFMGQLKGTAKT